MAAVIGALRADLSASIGQFVSDLGRAAKTVEGFAAKFDRVSQRLESAGMRMSLAITAPLIGIGVAAVKTAGDFEESMNKVEISTGAASGKMVELSKLARKIGKDTVFSATEAADAMDMLAKNGTSVEQILGGAARAAVDLAAAAGSTLDPAAAAVTDSIQQFGLTASKLPVIVNNITGAVNESKLDFADYQQAMGQAGGTAGALGVSFLDFNTVLAATSANFSSGSDAGTSFKTFLISLNPTTKKAAALIKQYGLSFYDAEGNLRSMSDIAQQLQDKLGGLNDQARAEVLKEIFGTDAMRTAIGLMKQGADGLDGVRKRIEETDAAAQAAKRMEGLNGQLRELGGALEDLAIGFGETGILVAITGIIANLTDLIDKLGEMPPVVMQAVAAIAAIAAIAGPVVLGLGLLSGAIVNIVGASALSGGALAGLGAIITSILAPALRVFAPLAAAFVLQLSVQFPAAAAAAAGALGALRTAMAFLLGPWGLVIGAIATAVAFLVVKLSQAPKPTREFESAIKGLDAATKAYEEAANAAAVATGKEGEAARIAAKKKRDLAVATRDSAKAKLAEAQATIAQITAENMRRITAENQPGGNRGDRPGSLGVRQGERRQAESNAAALQEQVTASNNAIKAADKAISDAEAMAAAVAEAGSGGGSAAPAGAATSVKDKADAIATATENLRESFRDLGTDIDQAFDRRQLPRSMQQAERLRDQLREMGEDAKKSGVNMAAFADDVAAAEKRINDLELIGLALEARQFAKEVEQLRQEVDDFDGVIAPLDHRLQSIDRDFESLRQEIVDQIDANRALAGANAEAASAMAVLEAQLNDLDAAHKRATDSAKALFESEQRLADLKNAAAVSETGQQITDLQTARGDRGLATKEQRDRQAIADDLLRQREAAEIKLAELQLQKQEAEATGDAVAAARLEAQIAMQQRLFDLVSETTAEQIQQQARLQQAWDDFTDGASDAVAQMFGDFKGGVDSLKRAFAKMIIDLLSQKAGQGISNIFANFAGGFATGGTLSAGQWGIAGENGPEPIFAGSARMSVVSNEDAFGGKGGGFYIDARGAGPREVDELRRMFENFDATFNRRVVSASNEGMMRGKIHPPSFSG